MSVEAGILIDCGWFKYEIKDEHLWICVFPEKEDDQDRSFESLVKSITEYGLPSELSTLLITVYNEATGELVDLCPIEGLEQKDGEIILEIDHAGMECTVYVKPSQGVGKMPTVADARNELDSHNVIVGVDEEKLKEIFEKRLWNEAFVIAKGKPAVDSQDGRIEYTFLGEKESSPHLKENGKVDFYNLNLVNNVKQGELLATIYAPVDGTEGVSIFGKVIAPKAGKRIVPPVGKNVELIENGTKIIANIEGEAIIEKNLVSVLQAHTVAGDIDFATGNIDFVGSVIIHGNVTNGFTVKAGGNVEVNGAVIGGTIEATGDVVVRNGIQGQNKGYIKTGGNLFARYIENATIIASNNVDGGEAIMHSEISSGGEVTVLSRKGVIVGGVIRAAKQVHCGVAGSEIGAVTVIEIGINPMAREELKNIYHDLPLKEKELEKAVKAVSILRQLEKSQSGLTAEKKEMLLNLMKTQYSLIGEVDRLKKRKTELELELENTKQGKLRVKEFLYPGVKLTIGKAIMHVEDTLQRATLLLEGAEIRVGQY